MSDVSVIGLGQMGSVLAELLLRSGRSVTVWNRSVGKGDALVRAGAQLASSPSQAFAASPIALVILYDDAAFAEVLADTHMGGALQGRLVVNLGTSGPETARAVAAELASVGARYVDGAIQAAPSQMGQPDTPILIAGAPEDLAKAEPVLPFSRAT